MADFPIPSFLQNQSPEEIYERMMAQLPDNIDKSHGSHTWNHTFPTAYEAAYMAQFVVVEAIKLIFPKYAQDYADIMMDHAEMRSLERKAATYATGEITITGTEGTEIPVGTAFATASIDGEPSIEFVTEEAATIGASGSVNVPVIAVEAGPSSNVPAGSIILKANKISGITDVTNAEDMTGGTEEESIEDLQTRIMDYDASQGVSYVGSDADYRRWALEVDGTGSALVIAPEDDTGLITIVLTDANGDPANEALREAVYNHIMRPDAPIERLAPVNGGNIQIVAPETIDIAISVTLETDGMTSLSVIKDNILDALKLYMVEATADQEVRYTKIGSIISKAAGVEDYKDLLLNGGTANISITNQQLPAIDEENLTVTAGTV